MRQAYDYWQNQPGNYREASEDAPGGHWGHPERLVTEMSAPGVRRRPGPAGDPCGLLLSPSKFPRGERAHAPAAVADGCDPDSPQVEDRFGRRPRWGGPPSRLPPVATVIGIASGQPPTEPIRRRQRALKGSRRTQGIRPARAPGSRGTLGLGTGGRPPSGNPHREAPFPAAYELHRGPPKSGLYDTGQRRRNARSAGGLRPSRRHLPRGAGPAMPTRTPRSRGAGRWGRVGLSGPGTRPLLPHRSNTVPSRVAPPPGARCHQNHSAGTDLYGKNNKCARGHRTTGPNCPQPGETVASTPGPGGRRGGRRGGAKASGRAPSPRARGRVPPEGQLCSAPAPQRRGVPVCWRNGG